MPSGRSLKKELSIKRRQTKHPQTGITMGQLMRDQTGRKGWKDAETKPRDFKRHVSDGVNRFQGGTMKATTHSKKLRAKRKAGRR